MRDDHLWLTDILEAIENIEKYAVRGQHAFETDELIQVWVISHLQRIGEASRALSASLKERYPDVPWRKIIGMRNILVHSYFSVDTTLVWAVVAHELPALKEHVEAILETL